MPITISAVITDTPTAKTFELAVPEGDAIAVDNDIAYATGPMGVFPSAPTVKIIENVTLETLPPTGPDNISIPVAGLAHMHITKASVLAGAVSQTFRVTLLDRSFFEL